MYGDRYFGKRYYGDRYYGDGGSLPGDTDSFVDQFRDAQYRRRLSWGLGCAALLLMTGCIQPPRRAVYDCLRPDVGNLLPDKVPCR
jgi:hypothetical protein